MQLEELKIIKVGVLCIRIDLYKQPVVLSFSYHIYRFNVLKTIKVHEEEKSVYKILNHILKRHTLLNVV